MCIFPLGGGIFGETTGRGIQEYHALIANHASTIRDSAVSSTTPYYNRFSCCHGADDAYARIYGYFKRQLARVSVRAAMLVRLRALDVIAHCQALSSTCNPTWMTMALVTTS